MMQRLFILLALVAAILQGCNNNSSVLIETPMGTMKAILYDDTPRHRDNFLRLVRNGEYDSLLFHRVIENHLIQGGDPNSCHPDPDVRLGTTSIGDPIDAEIRFPEHYHKRGAIAAARLPDKVNPELKSSGSQFYIVLGPKHSLDDIERQQSEHDNRNRSRIYLDILKFYQDSLQMLQDQGKAQELSDLQFRILDRVEEILDDRGRFQYTADMIKAYTTEGGLLELDGEYTVFGEIVDGFDVLDSISRVYVNLPSMRPADDIWMVIKEE